MDYIYIYYLGVLLAIPVMILVIKRTDDEIDKGLSFVFSPVFILLWPLSIISAAVLLVLLILIWVYEKLLEVIKNG